MKIQYLGTAAAEGWPAIFCTCQACQKARKLGGKQIRTRSQAIIDDAIIVDLPPDTYAHVLTQHLDLSKYETLIVTHSHQDHFYPLELMLRGAPYAHDCTAKLLTVYGNDVVYQRYQEALKENDSEDVPKHLKFVAAVPFQSVLLASGHTVTPLLARHKPDEDCLIYLISKEGKTLLYANDTGIFPEETFRFLEGKRLDCVSFDCTSQNGSDGTYHMGISDNRKVRERLTALHCVDETTKYVVTHFSHNGGLTHEEIEKIARSYKMTAAYDGYVLEF